MNQSYSEDFAARAFKRKAHGRPLSEKQLLAMEASRIADAHRRLKADFLARQEARECSAA